MVKRIVCKQADVIGIVLKQTINADMELMV